MSNSIKYHTEFTLFCDIINNNDPDELFKITKLTIPIADQDFDNYIGDINFINILISKLGYLYSAYLYEHYSNINNNQTLKTNFYDHINSKSNIPLTTRASMFDRCIAELFKEDSILQEYHSNLLFNAINEFKYDDKWENIFTSILNFINIAPSKFALNVELIDTLISDLNKFESPNTFAIPYSALCNLSSYLILNEYLSNLKVSNSDKKIIINREIFKEDIHSDFNINYYLFYKILHLHTKSLASYYFNLSANESRYVDNLIRSSYQEDDINDKLIYDRTRAFKPFILEMFQYFSWGFIYLIEINIIDTSATLSKNFETVATEIKNTGNLSEFSNTENIITHEAIEKETEFDLKWLLALTGTGNYGVHTSLLFKKVLKIAYTGSLDFLETADYAKYFHKVLSENTPYKLNEKEKSKLYLNGGATLKFIDLEYESFGWYNDYIEFKNDANYNSNIKYLENIIFKFNLSESRLIGANNPDFQINRSHTKEVIISIIKILRTYLYGLLGELVLCKSKNIEYTYKNTAEDIEVIFTFDETGKNNMPPDSYSFFDTKNFINFRLGCINDYLIILYFVDNWENQKDDPFLAFISSTLCDSLPNEILENKSNDLNLDYLNLVYRCYNPGVQNISNFGYIHSQLKLLFSIHSSTAIIESSISPKLYHNLLQSLKSLPDDQKDFTLYIYTLNLLIQIDTVEHFKLNENISLLNIKTSDINNYITNFIEEYFNDVIGEFKIYLQKEHIREQALGYELVSNKELNYKLALLNMTFLVGFSDLKYSSNIDEYLSSFIHPAGIAEDKLLNQLYIYYNTTYLSEKNLIDVKPYIIKLKNKLRLENKFNNELTLNLNTSHLSRLSFSNLINNNHLNFLETICEI
jgi:hypothetical protein